jgi:uncharacterized membrane protein YeaQ/YmgE (transglycosylase-associated protein family)
MHLTVAVIIWTVLIGLIIGALGRLIVPGRQNIGIFLTIVVAIIVAFIGFNIASALGVAHMSGVNWIEHGIQVVVAAIGVVLLGGTSRRSRV